MANIQFIGTADAIDEVLKEAIKAKAELIAEGSVLFPGETYIGYRLSDYPDKGRYAESFGHMVAGTMTSHSVTHEELIALGFTQIFAPVRGETYYVTNVIPGGWTLAPAFFKVTNVRVTLSDRMVVQLDDFSHYADRMNFYKVPERLRSAPEAAGPTREQLDALYDEGYTKGLVEGKAAARAQVREEMLALGFEEDSLNTCDRVVAAAKEARKAYWVECGSPRTSEPKAGSLKAWIAAIKAIGESFDASQA